MEYFTNVHKKLTRNQILVQLIANKIIFHPFSKPKKVFDK